ncbi:MAG: helix-turn-helix domain-containing protein [Caldilineaceae bacterium]
METPITPIPEQWLRDVETIKVFADPLRLKIIRLMAQPTTVKAVAEALDLAPAKLYYHVNLLQKHGLIQVVDHNLETGIVEKVYQVTAHQFKLVNPLIAGPEFPEEAADAIFSDMFQAATEGFQRALARRDKSEGTPPRHPFFSQKAVRLTDAQLSLVHSRLDALMKEVTALAQENSARDEPAYELTVVFYQKVDGG